MDERAGEGSQVENLIKQRSFRPNKNVKSKGFFTFSEKKVYFGGWGKFFFNSTHTKFRARKGAVPSCDSFSVFQFVVLKNGISLRFVDFGS